METREIRQLNNKEMRVSISRLDTSVLDLTGMKLYCYGLVTNNTVHMVTSKHYKTDKKNHFSVHVSPSIFIIITKRLWHPSLFQKLRGLFLHMLIIAGIMYTTVSAVLFLWFQPQNIFISW